MNFYLFHLNQISNNILFDKNYYLRICNHVELLVIQKKIIFELLIFHYFD